MCEGRRLGPLSHSLAVGKNLHQLDMTRGMYVWGVSVCYDSRYVCGGLWGKVARSTPLFPGSGEKLAWVRHDSMCVWYDSRYVGVYVCFGVSGWVQLFSGSGEKLG